MGRIHTHTDRHGPTHDASDSGKQGDTGVEILDESYLRGLTGPDDVDTHKEIPLISGSLALDPRPPNKEREPRSARASVLRARTSMDGQSIWHTQVWG